MAISGSTVPPRADEAMVGALRARMQGAVLDRRDPDYDAARRVWNGLIDRHPAVIARCAGTADVVEAVEVARQFRPVVSVRGGGHQVAGSAVCDDGLVIDLSAMRGVHVDPVARTARVQAGARWADVDRATQVFGLVTPGGEVSRTGVAGFTLGGGMGLIMRAHGLACDNVRSIEVVTADGVVRTAGRGEHPDLFWAARGGGRGIGIVTSFEFELHPLGPEVATAQVFYPYEQAREVLRAWRDLTATLPETVAPEFVLWNVPADPAVPTEMHGQKVVVVLAVHAGDPAEGAQVLAPLAELGTPLLDAGGTVPYVEVQSSVDALFPDGGRYFFKSHFLDGLTDEAIETLLACDADRPNPESLLVLRTLGGAVDRVGPEESAYPHRGARYNLSIDAGWTDPALDATALRWARTAWDAMRPYATGGVYLNFAGLDAETGAAALYGRGTDRLDAVRRAYDPDGVLADAAGKP
ncbi:FAD-binding oxidoreductase [Pseudonocardia sp. RS010]|uniref:FAD-binding oxidoreductase n=1 Tax=Pseudonocardia sp. RS010 TaxID=3385979 RepID=UPI0039A34DF9